jgi:hypothetical protein
MRANVKMSYSLTPEVPTLASVSPRLVAMKAPVHVLIFDLSTQIVDHHYHIHHNTLCKNRTTRRRKPILVVEGVSVGKLQDDRDREQKREGIHNAIYSLIILIA